MPFALIGSADPLFRTSLEQELSFLNKDQFVVRENVNSFLDSTPAEIPFVCLVDGRFSESETQEWTQTLKMTYPSVPVFVFYASEVPLNFTHITKNGADRLLHFYFDIEFLNESLFELCTLDFGSNPPLKALQAIDTNDLSDQIPLNFDLFVHLPHNHKTILLRKIGTTIQDETLQKAKAAGQQLFYSQSQKKQFFEYARTAQTMKNSAEAMTSTERALKFKQQFFEFLSEFFDHQKVDFEAGKKIFALGESMIQNFGLLENLTPEECKALIESRAGRPRSYYDEALNMALYCSLLAFIDGQDLERRLHLGLVGLYHNIGLSKLPVVGFVTQLSLLNPKDLEVFQNYPYSSVEMIKAKKVPLPSLVSDLIMQHQERPDGSGFPKKLTSENLHKDFAYVQLAYEFQNLTALSLNEEKRSPAQAAKKIYEESLAGSRQLNIPLCKKFFELLNGSPAKT
jgi:response regulator RpfG family c-di-GMP phosphodiesterase